MFVLINNTTLSHAMNLNISKSKDTLYIYMVGETRKIILTVTLSSVRNLLATFGGKLKNFGAHPD